MRIPPFCYITDYFRKRSEEKKNKFKAEILAELTAKTKSALDEQGKSVKEDGKRLVKEFSKEIKDDKKSLEAQLKDLLKEFSGVKYQSEKMSEEASAVKKDSERIKVYTEEAKTKAEGAEQGVKAMENAAKRANELCDKIDAKLEEYISLAVVAAVERCTATVKSEMNCALKKMCEEHKMNISESADLLEEKNMKKMDELSAKLNKAIKEEIEKFKKECGSAAETAKTECSSAIADLKKECSEEVDAFKKNYAAAQEDYQRIMPRIDVAAQKFKKLEDQIARIYEAMHDKPLYLVAATLLGSMKRKMLRELHSNEFKGDASRYKKSLEEWRDSKIKGKKNLTPAELEIEYVPRVFDDLLEILKTYDRDEVYALIEMADFVDGIKKNNNNSRPGSGRQSRH